MKNIISRNKLLVIAIVLILAISTGMTFAYFSDYEEAQGEASLALKGKTEIEEKFDGNNKEIKIYNMDDSEIDMVVRVKVFGPDYLNTDEVTYFKVQGDSNWTYNKSNGYWYYNKALAPGESTTVLEAIVKDVPIELIDSENDLEITVVHESEPAVYDTDNNLTPQSQWFN